MPRHSPTQDHLLSLVVSRIVRQITLGEPPGAHGASGKAAAGPPLPGARARRLFRWWHCPDGSDHLQRPGGLRIVGRGPLAKLAQEFQQERIGLSGVGARATATAHAVASPTIAP